MNQAKSHWHRSLELSPRFLDEILDQCRKQLSFAEVLGEVLPGKPSLIFSAFHKLFAPSEVARGKAFLEKVVVLLESQAEPLGPAQWHQKAVSHAFLGQVAAALSSYQAALDRDPRQADWRLEFGKLLFEQGLLEKARRELVIVCSERPSHAEAHNLLALVTRQIAQNR